MVNEGHKVLLRRHRKPTIGVILPMLSGFYMAKSRAHSEPTVQSTKSI